MILKMYINIKIDILKSISNIKMNQFLYIKFPKFFFC